MEVVWFFAAVLVGLIVGAGAAVIVSRFTNRDPLRCRIDEESGGLFIGRRNCNTHAVVWDDMGRCPRQGEETGQPFLMPFDVRAHYPGRY